ncbi:hypothetical protein AG1IA_06967 [Rhizoctonia solani AG-1 IA]|uniref:Uncharacterized protein n=1 Tax=Thanatephorus cucumeris (strain AG1-IA) TaxID=983506 RepID=L8WM29_THACA|nr:hypothetical protein AG1IA_06967 [Rhizoctonia solani AG-1 IA]
MCTDHVYTTHHVGCETNSVVSCFSRSSYVFSIILRHQLIGGEGTPWARMLGKSPSSGLGFFFLSQAMFGTSNWSDRNV